MRQMKVEYEHLEFGLMRATQFDGEGRAICITEFDPREVWVTAGTVESPGPRMFAFISQSPIVELNFTPLTELGARPLTAMVFK